ncbi:MULTISPECIES: GNAT family N-acetyltransferase [unclassified Enterococcus]|uniref:GNAT family N-acetyltransferase n=1 Tax=unclassified Enterococcus TaxID=2608891 RepID=UPI001554357A|nr:MULTISPECIES: GNAT family N-acetyltransferase [unclassified Enterococcus]MBS7576308.1 GNAT family N-acetyltransferase [Enterococcus sp. MMGLQ5-2]MBS7583541.1 GNAT family N-acetyltransferase [Enterococcus sp. MMGLQ5-1]NPD11403.1 GNAT family N-acetyltransferase [Enterococcus sp. MMGLQ5-1]NPD36146.1 GNAT family N-acetyltransferase [Enterococcus sp. MMGLQ5-2]
MEIKQVSNNYIDFVNLTQQLDKHLHELGAEEAEDEREKYDALNQVDNISWALIAYDDNLAIGCAAIKRFDDKTVEVKRVFVDDKYRGRGIARKLIHELEEKVKSEGYQELVLETGKNNLAAITMYQKFNYQFIDNYPPYENMSDSVCMKKILFV